MNNFCFVCCILYFMLYMQLLIEGANDLLLSLYKKHIKDKPLISTQQNSKTEEEMEIFEADNEKLDEDDLTGCFTLTQSKNEDGLTFTECDDKSRVYNFR